jgi:outer membrane protein
LAGLMLVVAAGASSAQTRTVTLEEAIELSLRNHPVAVAAETQVDQASARRLEALGTFLPSLTVNGIYANSSNQRFDQSTGRLVSTSYTAQTQMGYDIFTAGRRLVGLRSARAGANAADASLREARFATSLQTTSAYYQAAAAVALLDVARQRLERARQQQSFAATRLEVGTATRSDALRAELEVGNAELAVIDAESALRSARLSLGRQIGTGGEVEPAETELPEDIPALIGADSLAGIAARTSPLVAAAAANEVALSADRLSAYTAYVPSLRLTGGLDWFSPTYPPENRSWSLRLQASLPVFNGFQREANVQRAEAAERLAEARARDAVLNARAAAVDAAQQIESAGRRVVIARRAVELAQEDLRVQEERYQIGSATIVELQTSQVALAEAKSTFVRSKQQLGVAVATLEAVLGERIVNVF